MLWRGHILTSNRIHRTHVYIRKATQNQKAASQQQVGVFTTSAKHAKAERVRARKDWHCRAPVTPAISPWRAPVACVPRLWQRQTFSRRLLSQYPKPIQFISPATPQTKSRRTCVSELEQATQVQRREGGAATRQPINARVRQELTTTQIQISQQLTALAKRKH